MPDLTIFAIPKPFTGHSAVIQENALRSWTGLSNTEVLLCGKDEGVAEAARAYGAGLIEELDYTSLGTPLLDSAFSRARERALGTTLCYVNADIILFDDLLDALGSIDLPRYVAVARRRNLDVTEHLHLQDAAARERFLDTVRQEALLETPFGSDLFAFPRELEWDLPAFAVGRPAWDNWFMFQAVKGKIPLVDVTDSAIVVHQNHSYVHVPAGRGTSWEGPEADANRALLGDPDETASLLDATHVLVNGKLTRPHGAEYRRARILMWGKRSRLARNVLKIGRPVFRAVKGTLPRVRSGGR